MALMVKMASDGRGVIRDEVLAERHTIKCRQVTRKGVAALQVDLLVGRKVYTFPSLEAACDAADRWAERVGHHPDATALRQWEEYLKGAAVGRRWVN